MPLTSTQRKKHGGLKFDGDDAAEFECIVACLNDLWPVGIVETAAALPEVPGNLLPCTRAIVVQR